MEIFGSIASDKVALDLPVGRPRSDFLKRNRELSNAMAAIFCKTQNTSRLGEIRFCVIQRKREGATKDLCSGGVFCKVDPVAVSPLLPDPSHVAQRNVARDDICENFLITRSAFCVSPVLTVIMEG